MDLVSRGIACTYERKFLMGKITALRADQYLPFDRAGEPPGLQSVSNRGSRGSVGSTWDPSVYETPATDRTIRGSVGSAWDPSVYEADNIGVQRAWTSTSRPSSVPASASSISTRQAWDPQLYESSFNQYAKPQTLRAYNSDAAGSAGYSQPATQRLYAAHTPGTGVVPAAAASADYVACLPSVSRMRSDSEAGYVDLSDPDSMK